MKKLLTFLAVSVGLCGSAYASTPTTGLYVSDATGSFTTSGFNGVQSLVGEQSFVFGTLMSAQAGTLTFSYVGSEAGHTDKFFTFNDLRFNNKTSPNSAFSLEIAAGQSLSFSFNDASSSKTVANGASVVAWGSSNANSWQNTFGLKKESDNSFLLMYNDYVNNGDRDFDDMVVRVSLAPVPEPETYAMFLAGLGLMGAIARRRIQQAVV